MHDSVPLLDLGAQNLPLEDEYTAAFQRVFRSSRFIMGPEVEKLESVIAEMCGAAHGIGVSSGTDALLLALMSLGIGPGDEVLCPTFTFFASGGSIARTGATPVWVDVCPVCFNIDLADAERKITSRSKAIMPVHLFGQAAEMDGCMALAEKHHLHVIEDAAQALGARYRGKYVGTFGEFGTFSFFPSKNLGGFGDGGMVLTNDDELANQARILRVHGGRPKYYHKFVGGNFRLDPLQAALLAVKLPHLHRYSVMRKANAEYYIEHLGAIPGVAQADPAACCCPIEKASQDLTQKGVKVVLPVAYDHCDHIWNQFTLRVINPASAAEPVAGAELTPRDQLKEHLIAQGVGCEIYYPLTLDRQECFTNNSHGGETISAAHQLSSEVLSIPIFPELTGPQKARVVQVIAEGIQGI